jgi:hypothetical protein
MKTNAKKYVPKMSRSKAMELLYEMWENGEVPSNFTEDHSEYESAIQHLMRFGYLIREELFLF